MKGEPKQAMLVAGHYCCRDDVPTSEGGLGAGRFSIRHSITDTSAALCLNPAHEKKGKGVLIDGN